MAAPESTLVKEEISRRSDPPSHHANHGSGETADTLLQAHMPGLDLLRGLAVTMVVVYHLLYYDATHFPWHNPILRFVFYLFGAGWTGVSLFFVLSGFLITGNLMDSLGKPNYYARFYIRRGLRILPLYYVLVLFCALTREASWNYTLACALFLANMPKLILHGAYYGKIPAWSLAVEEQFYLIWPTIYKHLRRRWLIALCIATMAMCPILRWAANANIVHMGEIFSKTWMIGDNLAVGALLAAVLRTPRVSLRAIKWTGIIVFAAAFSLLLVAVACFGSLKQSSVGVSIGYSLMELTFAGTLTLALVLFRQRKLPRVLTVFVFLADVSYGLYLFHIPCSEIYDHFIGHAFQTSATALLTRFVLVSLAATSIAAISKKFFENPIMKLRKRIPSAT